MNGNVKDPLTICLVGDVISCRPMIGLAKWDPGIMAVSEMLKRAALVCGNLETPLVDVARFRGSVREANDWLLRADPVMASDLAAIGMRLVSRANNHAMDWGLDGMTETSMHLDRAGVVSAGVGASLSMALAPSYIDIERARVAMISVYVCEHWNQDRALDQVGRVPGNAGVGAIRVRAEVTVPRRGLSALGELASVLGPKDPLGKGRSRIELLEHTFRRGAKYGISYVPNENDMRRLEESVRQGSAGADIVIVSIHAHQQECAGNPRLLRTIAKRVTSAGAGIVACHGPHVIGGVEIMCGKPVLYGLGNFSFSGLSEPQHGHWREHRVVKARSMKLKRSLTDAEVNDILDRKYRGEIYHQGICAEVSYAGKQVAVRIVPLNLGANREATLCGVPRLANGRIARKALERTAMLSKRLGTRVCIEGSVGLVQMGVANRRVSI